MSVSQVIIHSDSDNDHNPKADRQSVCRGSEGGTWGLFSLLSKLRPGQHLNLRAPGKSSSCKPVVSCGPGGKVGHWPTGRLLGRSSAPPGWTSKYLDKLVNSKFLLLFSSRCCVLCWSETTNLPSYQHWSKAASLNTYFPLKKIKPTRLYILL